MPRYIDANKLKERLEIISVVADNWYEMGINRGLDRAEIEIDMLPTADVEEVVHCKDCVHHGKFSCSMSGFKYPKNTKDTDFCSYGIRKENKYEQ